MSEYEKLKTKINSINDDKILVTDNNVSYVSDDINIELFKYDEENITYNNIVYFPTMEEKIKTNNYEYIQFLLNNRTVSLLNTNILNPPKNINNIISTVSQLLNATIKKLIIGTDTTKFDNATLSLSLDDYAILKKIIYEARIDKNTQIKRRFSIHLCNSLNVEVEDSDDNLDYNMLVQEGITLGEIDIDYARKILNLSQDINSKAVIIDNQINKQAKWLIDTIQEIIDIEKITLPIAKELAKKYFGWPKNSISGSEKLMEKILTEYGKNIIFGVPALINVNKYVVNSEGLPRSQFDLLLVNYLNDIEIVELKRPDMYLLEYDEGRRKFYWSKDIAIAVGQTERYLSTIIKDNDDSYKIDGKKIREFINDNIGGVVTIDEITRPTAIIIAGRIQSIAPPYKVAYGDKTFYDNNSMKSYKELSVSLKNIRIMTYTELIEGVRLRESVDDLRNDHK